MLSLSDYVMVRRSNFITTRCAFTISRTSAIMPYICTNALLLESA